MFCEKCGTALEPTANFCSNCNAAVHAAQPVVTPPAQIVTAIPEENRPLSPWAYFGLQLLFAVPIVGFIFLIIFSINGSNINRRNFARSYWCGLIVCLIIFVLFIVIAAITGASLYQILS